MVRSGPIQSAPDGERRLAAIVFSDVVGYTARMQRDETGTMALVGADFARMAALAADEEGEGLNTMGDGMLVGFPSAVQAVTFALQAQAEFAHRRVLKPPEKALEHRIGIHVGDVFRMDGRVAGDGVNIAARVQAKAPACGICVTQTVYDLIRGKVTVEAVALGPQEFKNIAEKIPVYHLVLPVGGGPLLPRKHGVGMAIAGIAVLLTAIGVLWWRYRPGGGAPAGSASAGSASAAYAVTAPANKSIAVLPFVNMSSDKENAYFCDGVQEDLLTNLANIAELRVVSRTSVEQYRGATKPIRQIAQELGVSWILEGSVQREGGKVRVTGQLINAATDEHVWAKSYDRDLADIFAIQSELAQTIASSLQTALSPQENSLVERKPTANTAAYDLYLKAKAVGRDDASFSPAGAQKLETLLSAAVDLDPNFAEAWGLLAYVHARAYFVGYDKSPDRLGKAKTAIDKAVSIAPDSPEIVRFLGFYYYLTQRDYARAEEQFEKFAHMEPNSIFAWGALGVVQRSEGRWLNAIESERRGVQLDPRGVNVARNLLASLRMCRRYDEALALGRQIVAMNTGSIDQFSVIAATEFAATGDTREAGEFLASQEAKDPNSGRFTGYHKLLAQMHGDFAEAARIDRLQSFTVEDNPGILAKRVQALYAAEVYRALGDVASARARLGDFPAQLRARLVSEPTNGPIWQALGRMELILGHNDEALRCAEKATELPEAKDGFDGPPAWINIAIIHAWTGDKGRAIAELADILRRPSYLNVNSMRCEAAYVVLRGNPRFEALISDPKNNTPLF